MGALDRQADDHRKGIADREVVTLVAEASDVAATVSPRETLFADCRLPTAVDVWLRAASAIGPGPKLPV